MIQRVGHYASRWAQDKHHHREDIILISRIISLSGPRRRLTTVVALMLFAILLAASAARANTCPASHCYALAYWYHSNLGTDASLRTISASVPEPNSDFVTSEEWDGFSGENGWIEAGDYSGYGPQHNTTGLDYYTAVDYPTGSPIQGYYEADLNYGPGNTWFEDDIHAAGNGVWAIFLGGSNVWNWGSLPGAAYYPEAGMEATNSNITASGEFSNLAYWSSSTGQLVYGWPGDSPYKAGQTCITLYGGDISGSFANKSSGC